MLRLINSATMPNHLDGRIVIKSEWEIYLDLLHGLSYNAGDWRVIVIRSEGKSIYLDMLQFSHNAEDGGEHTKGSDAKAGDEFMSYIHVGSLTNPNDFSCGLIPN